MIDREKMFELGSLSYSVFTAIEDFISKRIEGYLCRLFYLTEYTCISIVPIAKNRIAAQIEWPKFPEKLIALSAIISQFICLFSI